MISFVRGRVFSLEEEALILDTGALGYRVFVPADALRNLELDDEVFFYTYHHVKEDGQSLYGFSQAKEKELFKELISVSGIGPKLAMTMLSSKSSREIILATGQERVDVLTEIPGIGAKTAKRLILELKDKMLDYLSALDPLLQEGGFKGTLEEEGPLDDDVVSQAILALESLGYQRREVEKLVTRLAGLEGNGEVSCLITQSLKELAR